MPQKLLAENIGEYLPDLQVGKTFRLWQLHKKALTIKEKSNTLISWATLTLRAAVPQKIPFQE